MARSHLGHFVVSGTLACTSGQRPTRGVAVPPLAVIEASPSGAETACDEERSVDDDDPDCVRTYGHDCAALSACLRGEPGFFPRCQRGFRNHGAMGRCTRTCRAGGCPPDEVCSAEAGAPMICVPR
jgi:hypothetical protein